MLAASMMEWQNDENAADAGDETDTERQHMSSDDELGFEEGIDDFSDEFDDFSDNLDDGFDDDEFGGFDDDNNEEPAELEDRVGEPENEVGAVSSRMNTVCEEDKQIGETVGELDDTIRKLLDIYEVITRGINPFIGDTREMGGLDGGGAFGLFEVETEDEEYLDPGVMGTDAESFFDDDFGELDTKGGAKEAEFAAEDELTEAERESPADVLDDEGDEHDEADEADETDDAGDAGGASFDNLKEQYEKDDGWDDRDDAATDDAETDLDDAAVDLEDEDDDAPDDANPLNSGAVDGVEEDDEPGDEVSDESEADPAPEIENSEQDADGDVRKTLDELEAEYATMAGVKDGLSGDGEDDAVTGPESSASVEESGAYPVTPPSGHVSGVLILKWVGHLVTVGGALGASRAFRQHREQDWISYAIENELSAHVGQIAPSAEDADSRELRIDNHQTSLACVCRPAEDVPRGQLYEELAAYGGRFDGVRC